MKTVISVSIVVSLLLLVSASVWEGVTDVVSAGDLPGNYSVATNSFPKNSVVDITNLENGKIVRAIVVSGLETKGLLATLSRNAANSLDLRGNSTCRIRITQPSDDIAFSRFKLGPIVAPPSSVSESDTLSENTVSEDTDRTDKDEAQNITAVKSDSDADNTAVIGAAVIGAGNANTGAGYPVAADAATVTQETAVKRVKPVLKSTEVITSQTMSEAAAEPAKPVKEIAPARTRAAQAPATVVTKTTPRDTVKASVQASLEPAVEPVKGEIAETMTGTQAAEIIPQDTAVQVFVQAVAESSVEPVREETEETMTGAQAAEIIPQDMIAQASVQPVTEQSAYTAAEPVTAAVTKSVIPAALNNPPESRNAGNLSIIFSEERIPESANRFVIAPEDRAPPLKKNIVSDSSSPSATSDFSPFQVPLISRLEQGKCYVQIAAYQRVEHVEDEINRIGTTYPLAVQNVGSDANPMFRVLLGPLNQGESGAMLQRFRSIGYNDAFIRYN